MGTKIELDFETAVGITRTVLKDDLEMIESDLASGKLLDEDIVIHENISRAIKTLLDQWYGA